MSDEVKTFLELCPHGEVERHQFLSPTWNEKVSITLSDPRDHPWCSGATEIRVREVAPAEHDEYRGTNWFEHSQPQGARVWSEITDEGGE